MGLLDFLKEFFGSNSLRKADFYSLRNKVNDWARSRSYPGYYELPPVITFPAEFWARVAEISRHTRGDGHERAVTVWWADGEYVLTESIRGDAQHVCIPESRILVEYKPIPGTDTADRIVSVNGKVYSKRRVFLSTLRGKKNLEVMYLFNLHTHPPRVDIMTGNRVYSLFSSIDLKGFLETPAAVTGLVTDQLWLLFKTKNSPQTFARENSFVATPEILTQELGLKVYRAQFGRGAVIEGFRSE